MKFLVKTEILDVLFANDHLDVATNRSFAERGEHPLKVWIDTCRAINFLSRKGCEITLRSSHNQDFRVPRISELSVPTDSRWIVEVIDVLEAALTLRHLSNSDDRPISVSSVFENAGNIKRARALVGGTNNGTAYCGATIRMRLARQSG
jgi:hypothetical protein